MTNGSKRPQQDVTVSKLAVFACVIPAILSGCNTHPLPEDVSRRDTTYQIVAKIRCEARDAIRNIAIRELYASDSPSDREMAIRLDRRLRSFTGAYREISPQQKEKFRRYEQAAIAYKFTLDMTENNNNSINLNLLNPFGNGSRRLGVGGSVDLQRQNVREFTIADKFADLALNLDDEYCAVRVRSGNLIYPITGTIGIDEAVTTFILLNERGNIAAGDKTLKTMVDVIEFTTKLTGSLTPSIELIPVDSGIGLSTASLGSSTIRTDKHKVSFALSMPPAPEAARSISRADGRVLKTAKDAAIEGIVQQEENNLSRKLQIIIDQAQ